MYLFNGVLRLFSFIYRWKNDLLGVISIYSLLLWLIQQVIIIILELLKSKRNN